MAVNKELRTYIENKYQEKISVARVEFAKTKTNNAEIIKKELEEFSQRVTEIKSLIKSVGLSPSSNLLNLESPKNLYYVPSEEVPEVKRLIEERNKLLIMLSLEKDFDRINKLLEQFNISL